MLEWLFGPWNLRRILFIRGALMFWLHSLLGRCRCGWSPLRVRQIVSPLFLLGWLFLQRFWISFGRRWILGLRSRRIFPHRRVWRIGFQLRGHFLPWWWTYICIPEVRWHWWCRNGSGWQLMPGTMSLAGVLRWESPPLVPRHCCLVNLWSWAGSYSFSMFRGLFLFLR